MSVADGATVQSSQISVGVGSVTNSTATLTIGGGAAPATVSTTGDLEIGGASGSLNMVDGAGTLNVGADLQLGTMLGDVNDRAARRWHIPAG